METEAHSSVGQLVSAVILGLVEDAPGRFRATRERGQRREDSGDAGGEWAVLAEGNAEKCAARICEEASWWQAQPLPPEVKVYVRVGVAAQSALWWGGVGSALARLDGRLLVECWLKVGELAALRDVLAAARGPSDVRER